MDQEGYLHVADRRVDLIIRGGANVYPAEVEPALEVHPLVQSCAVIGLPDEDMGSQIHAIIPPRPGLDLDDLARHLGERVVGYNRPRSYELTDRHWFRVAAILWVASTIVAVMLSVMSAFVTVPFTVYEAFRGQLGLTPTEAAISGAVTSVTRILLASIGSIVYTLLFIDLRNRREGTDIVERVSQLETSPLPASG